MPITKEMGTDADLVENTPRLNSRDSAALKDIMKKRLTECGWRKDIEQMIRQTIQEHGVGTLTSDQLAEKIVPHVGTSLGTRRNLQGDDDTGA
ncbi:enhancer of yellow 2b transcription factor isoform X2 [Drosophila kikkawai]|uniref:Enhancer of yellow 2b transcription factor isoform X2 n=1 Tax=Drosophila kikkawai TaxID=30033 RepID=A0A6P4ISH4_DROKI|nr:enhancer of yellow 2b transcription factor isoform X2 [Drosophila kikkawai]